MARITTPEQLQHTLLGDAETTLVMRLSDMDVEKPYDVLNEIFSTVHFQGFVQKLMSENRSLDDDLTSAREELRTLKG